MSHPPSLVPVLFVGDSERTEFAAVFQWLREHSRMSSSPDFAVAAAQLETHACDPELIVVAQSWPGQFSPKQIERLRWLAPLGRISELLGSWCEGETRTGRPPGGTLRNYWHQWLPRMAPEFERSARGERPVWSLATTATDDERLLAIADAAPAAPAPHAPAPQRGLIAILLRNAAMARALCDACPTRGYASIWLPDGRATYMAGVRAAIWDAPPAIESWAGLLANLDRDLKGTPVIALASFPRIEDIDRLRAAGAAAVVSKPFWLDDLFWQVEQL
jgi:hypothetical protein